MSKAKLVFRPTTRCSTRIPNRKRKKLEIYIPNGPRLGNVVIEAKNVTKAFGDRVLYENLNFSLPPAGIVGVIGPQRYGQDHPFPDDNGAGTAHLRRVPGG